MQVVESADGTIRVIELDPTKTHLFVVDAGALTESDLFALADQPLRDGLILRMSPGAVLTIIEGVDPKTTITVGGG